MSEKIIHSFQQRRQLERAMEQLAQTESEQALLEQVRDLARDYPADLLLQTLVRHLDTASSQLRGGLGHLATLLPPDETFDALRRAAANRQGTPQTRLTAALLADRFLGQPIPPALISDLAGSDDVAFQSLVEAVEEGKRNRHVLLEYVIQMRDMGQEIAFMVMDALDRLPAADRPPLLRLIAHDERLPVAQRAVERLIRLAEDEAAAAKNRRPDPGPESAAANTPVQLSAIKALHVLAFTLPPRLTEPIARTNRKLRFAGTGYSPPPATGWRGLISPADMGGNQTVWCFHRPAHDEPGVLLGLVINPRVGIIQAFGSETIAPEHLPHTQAVGQMTLMKNDSGENAVLLEAPFDFCRARILAALQAHWQSEPRRALLPEYQLYNDLIWQFAPPREDETLARFFQAQASSPPEHADEAKAAAQQEKLDRCAAQLLQHPAMSHWRVQNRMLQQLLRLARVSDQRDEDEKTGEAAAPSASDLITQVLRELASRPETKEIVTAMTTGLHAQAAWLHMTGDANAAEQAFTLAQALPGLSVADNPLLAHMIAASIGAET